MAKTIANYDLDCLGHSLVAIDEHGVIIRTELPWKRFQGRKLSEMERELEKTRPQAFHGLKFVGYTRDETLVMRGSSEDPEMRKQRAKP